MRAFCNTHSDFQMQKTDLTNQIAAFLDMLCFKSDNELAKTLVYSYKFRFFSFW